MKLHVFAVGHKQPGWIDDGCAEYIKRMPKEFFLSLVEIKPEARNSGKTREQIMAAEKVRIGERLSACGSACIVALDERGLDLTTVSMARKLEYRVGEGGDMVFLIGGADGLDPALKKQAAEMWRLSSLTLPHGLARLLLCEQLYRAVSILRNHPYHRE